MVAPPYAEVFSYAMFLTTIAEFSFMFYLPINGFKTNSTKLYASAI